MKRLIVLMVIMIGVNNKFIEIPFSSFSTAGKGFEGLPNEFPKLISLFEQLKDSYPRIYGVIRTLEPVIGYLPPIEQYALYTSINKQTDSSALIFEQDKYIGFMEKEISSLNNLSPLKYEIESYKNYLTNSSALLGSGMSCLQKVINKFGYDSPKNNDIIKQIYKQFDSILKQQSDSRISDLDFFQALFTIGFIKRKYLFQIQQNFNPSTCSFCSISNGVLKGFKYYQSDDKDVNLVDKFISYLSSKISRNIVLNEGIMNIEKEIGSMIGCMNEKDNNLDAGKSSDGVDIPEINYHGKEIIGINNGNRIRNDGRTQNNFTLNHGFNLGKYSNTNFKISDKWNNYLNQILTQLTQLTDENSQTLIRENIELIKQNNNLVGTANLHQQIILKTRSAYSTSTRNQIIKDIQQMNCQSPSIINVTCDDNECKKLDSTDSPNDSNDVVIVGCISSKKIIFSKDSNGLCDIVYDNESLGKEHSDILSGCNGVFIGGGKDDKEACRGVLKKKCANEIDFRCKQTGLYDYLNQNPLLELPDACADTSSDECLRWIDHAFMLGGLIPKPTQFQTFSLTANSWKLFNNDKFDRLFGQNSFNYLTTTNPPSDGDFKNVVDKAFESFNDLKDDSEEVLKNIMDRAFTSIVNSSNFLKTSFGLIKLIFFLL